MQEKHTDSHIMMVAALVFVAASAIFQTALGLSADKLGAAESSRMFATVVAASGKTVNPRVERYTKQLRSVMINEDGHAALRGVVSSADTRTIMVSTWGGDWKIVISSATKVLGQQGKLDVANIKPGDYVFISGIAENSGAAIISAQSVADYTLYRAPVGQSQDHAVVAPEEPEATSATTATNSPRVLPMRSDGTFDARTLGGANTSDSVNPRIEMRARYNISANPAQ